MDQPVSPIRLPDVAAIGWIPFYLELSDVPQNAYKLTRPTAYDFLFDSGNRDPRDNLVNYGGFRAIIDSHDYRGALLLKDLEIHRNQDGRFTHYNSAIFKRLESVGFTPLRYKVKGPQKRKEPWAACPERRGIGGTMPGLPSINVWPEVVTITQGVQFRLCRLLGLGSGIMTFTFRDAPHAWMKWTITLAWDGAFQILFHGSAVPSQKLFVGWKSPPNCMYDMVTASHHEMENFFMAGRWLGVGATRRAPGRLQPPLVYSTKLW